MVNISLNREIENGRLVSLVSLDSIESSALDQIKDILAVPVVKKMAIMPDVHTGYDMPIGGVALIDGYIWPNAVGFDIGCGMCFTDTRIKASDMFENDRDKREIFNRINKEIPCGVGKQHKEPSTDEVFHSALNDDAFDRIVNSNLNNQFGTLGSGNHFIEIGENLNGNVCVTIHSGSRKPGWNVARHYMNLAKFGGEKFSIDGRRSPITMLPLDSDLGKAYVEDMNWMLEFALENRLDMMGVILSILGVRSFNWDSFINENHNHAVVDNGVAIHRKGSTPAELNVKGVIPGNMRDGVYITVGKGNEHFLNSASHGAGRVMSRKKARESVNIDEFKSSMKGIVAPVDKNRLDESPFAYKDIHGVIKAQNGIVVNVVDWIKPLINVKG